MERRSNIGALVLSVVLMVSLLGASFAGDVPRERAGEEEGTITTGDPGSSGDEGVVVIASSQDNFAEPEVEEETREHEAEEETTHPPHGQEEATAQSSDAAAEAGVDEVVSPSAKVIIWDESVDLAATADPNQGRAPAGGAARERKEPPPSQERHSDVDEASKKKEEEAGAGEESQIVSEGRSQVNSAASSLSSSIWKTALFTVFGSTVLLFLMKNDQDSTSKQQSYNRCSNSQCNRRQETSDREQLTRQFTHHSSAPL